MDQVKKQFLFGIFALCFGLQPISAAVVPAAPAADSTSLLGNVSFEGSTIVSIVPTFQLGLIYKKFPSDAPVVPLEPWQLSFGAVLASQAASIPVTLRLENAQQHPDIQIPVDTADFVPQDGLYVNFDPSARFEIQYTGALNPYMGPIDFVLAPDGFPDIPVRVHLNVTEQSGFPLPIFPSPNATAVVGNITGDEALEIIIPGGFGSWQSPDALHAFDPTGNPVPGWPIFPGVPGSGSFRTPTIVDLDGDGHDEIVVIGILFNQNVSSDGGAAGTGFSTSLYVVEGTGQIRWQATAADLEDFSYPAVGDLDGDGDLDILTSTLTNMMRFEADGTPVTGWQVETLNDIRVTVPIIGDLDGNPANGKEIVACSPVSGLNVPDQVYVWNQDGSLRSPLWPKELEACVAPAIVDLDGNPSNGLEIVMAIDFDPNPPVDPETGFPNTFTVFAWHGDGSDVSGWPHRFLRDPILGYIDDRILPSVSAADLDGNGDMEIIVSTYGQGDPANGNLFVFHHDGTLDPNWPQWGGLAQTPSETGGVALADLDGDGLLEIVTGAFHGVYAFRANGQPFEGFPRRTSDNFSHATIADLDRDGKLEIVQPSLLGRLHTWQLLTPTLDRVGWPQFRQNPAHTGTRNDGPIAAIPAVSAAGLAATTLLLIGAGVVILKRQRERLVS